MKASKISEWSRRNLVSNSLHYISLEATSCFKFLDTTVEITLYILDSWLITSTSLCCTTYSIFPLPDFSESCWYSQVILIPFSFIFLMFSYKLDLALMLLAYLIPFVNCFCSCHTISGFHCNSIQVICSRESRYRSYWGEHLSLYISKESFNFFAWYY